MSIEWRNSSKHEVGHTPLIPSRLCESSSSAPPTTPVPSLHACLELPGSEVVAVVTQPDRARGRSGRAVATPVKELALEAGVNEILQPVKTRRDTTERLAALQPDVGVVAAYGNILPTHLLEEFPHDLLNVHASLLPKHRGAAPVAAAILAGDAETGASNHEGGARTRCRARHR